MSLSTLSGVKTAALDELDRTDLSSYADDFITMAEGHFNRNLRHRKMVTSADLTPTSNVYTLPTDYLEAVRVVEKASIRRELKAISPAVADQYYADRTAGLACDYTIVGSSLTAFPLSSNTIELTYYQKIPTLLTTDPNWLLTEAPQLYYRGIQLMALQFINENGTPRFQTVARIVEVLINELNAQSERAIFSKMTMRIAGPTP